MSDIQIVALALTAESLSIDSENLLFFKLKNEYQQDFPNLIDRSNFNRRRKRLVNFISFVSQSVAMYIEPDNSSYIIDSMPVPICKNIRIARSKICNNDQDVSPSRSYHACHKTYYFGFKLQLITTVSGIPYYAALTTASAHDSQFLSHIKNVQISDCQLIADMGYLSKCRQLELFDSYNIKLITPNRSNMKTINLDWTKQTRKSRKRIETLISQLDDQMMIKRNYAKSLEGLLTRICTKVSSAAALQFLNSISNKPLNKIKHALAS
jgi:hypothetical protein